MILQFWPIVCDGTPSYQQTGKMLAKAAGAEVESEESGDEEGELRGVINYMTMREAPVQVNHITDACCYAQQQEIIKTISKLQAQLTDFRSYCLNVLVMLQICCV